MSQLKDVLQEAATLLNDSGMSFWIGPRLLPFARRAHMELQIKLALNGLPVLKKKSSVILVTAGSSDLGANQPTDLIEPTSLWERQAGSSDDFTEMVEKGWEPEAQQTRTLVYWVWRGEKIMFLPATSDREVKIYFQAGIAVPAAEEDSIGLLFGELYMGPRTASLAALSLGNPATHDKYKDMADNSLEEVIAVNIRGQQALPVRRLPYHYRSRIRRF